MSEDEKETDENKDFDKRWNKHIEEKQILHFDVSNLEKIDMGIYERKYMIVYLMYLFKYDTLAMDDFKNLISRLSDKELEDFIKKYRSSLLCAPILR